MSVRKFVSAMVTIVVFALAGTVVHAAGIDVGGLDQAGGTIKGIVKFDGKQVKRKPIRMSADPVCNNAHKDSPSLSERYVFGDNDTLQNVFVYVSKGLEGKTFQASGPATIDQVGCVYVPHVSGVVANQQINILNSDATLHNVKCSPKNNDSFNEGMPVKGMKITKSFSKPEMAISLKCDVHAWMQAYVHVMPHPFFAVTQQAGTFEIKGLPAGTYEVSVWHAFSKFAPSEKTITVEVKEGSAAEANFTYSPKKRKK